MDRTLSNFEQNIRNSFDGVELPYDPESWKQLENHLGEEGKSNSPRNWLIAASFIAVAATASILIINGAGSTTATSAKIHNSNTEIFLAEGVFLKLTNTDSLVSKEESGDNSSAFVLTNGDVSQDEFADNNVIDQDPNSNSENGTDNTTSDNSEVGNSNDESAINTVDSEKSNNTSDSDENKSVVDMDAIVPSISVSKSVACQGESIDFSIASGNIDGNYLWNFGNGDFSDEPTAFTVYSEPGNYKVSMSVTSSADGQMRRIDISSDIEILPTPEAIFSFEYVDGYTSVPTVKFINTSENAMDSYWEFDSQIISSEISPIQVFEEKGDHIAKLVVSNQYGCSDTEIKTVSIRRDYNLLADKSFSPTKDGRNDYFIPNALRVLENSYSFKVYQDGELIFDSNDESEIKEWDGSLLDGGIAESGKKFQWVVILIDDNNEEQFYDGEITIVP